MKPPKQPATHSVSVRLTDDELETLVRMAGHHTRTLREEARHHVVTAIRAAQRAFALEDAAREREEASARRRRSK